MRGACSSDAHGPETAKVKVPWSGGCFGGRSNTEDGRGVSVVGTPEALIEGTTEGLRPESAEALVVETAKLPPGTPKGPQPESPEVLVLETVKAQPAVMETPEAVDLGIPEGPAS